MSDINTKKYKLSQRTFSPAKTIEKVKALMPDMGITRISNVTGLDYIGINVVMVTRPNSRSVSVSQGKGVTLNDAIASGLMESVESWHAERIQDKYIVFESSTRIGNHAIIDILPRSSSKQIEATQQIHWIKGTDLINGQDCWVPYDLVHTNFTDSRISDGLFISCTNGLASGNHYLEAVLHGIYEVVERDALTLWNISSVANKKRTRVDLNSITDPVIKQILAQYSNANVDIGTWEITSDAELPAFVCSILPREEKYYFSSWASVGSGCHLDVHTALRRAMTEAAQVRITCIVGAREDLISSNYINDKIEEKEIIQSYIENCKSHPLNVIVQQKSLATNDLKNDIEIVLEKLSLININQVIAVDLTRKDFRIPVVRVTLPGLEGPDEHLNYRPGLRAMGVLEKNAQ